MTQKADSGSPIHFRLATPADRPRLIPLINSAFSIETFLEGTRTDEARLASMMEKGSILVAEDLSGRLLACVYTELRGNRGYLGQLAVGRFRQLGCEAVDITVLSLRPELLPIYRRFGYIETGTEEFNPSRPLKPGLECHCIVMSKKL